MPICPVFGLVSRICPDIDKLRYFTVRILILTCWSLYNLYTKKSLAAGAPPRTPLGELMMLSQTSKLDPRQLVNVVLAPYDSRLQRSSDCGAKIMVILQAFVAGISNLPT